MSWSTSRLRRLLLSYLSPRNQLHVTGFAIFSSNSHKLCAQDLRLHEAAFCVWNKDVGHPEQAHVIVSSDGDLFVQSNVFLRKDLSVLCAKSFLCFPWEGHVVVHSIFLSWRTNGSKRKRDRHHHHVKVVKEKMTSEWQWLSISSSRLKRQEEEEDERRDDTHCVISTRFHSSSFPWHTMLTSLIELMSSTKNQTRVTRGRWLSVYCRQNEERERERDACVLLVCQIKRRCLMWEIVLVAGKLLWGENEVLCVASLIIIKSACVWLIIVISDPKLESRGCHQKMNHYQMMSYFLLKPF